MRASPLRIVERKQPRLDFLNRKTRHRTSIFRRKRQPVPRRASDTGSARRAVSSRTVRSRRIRTISGRCPCQACAVSARCSRQSGSARAVHIQNAVADFQRRFYRLRHALRHLLALDHQTVDHDLNVVLNVFFQRRRVFKVIDLAVNLDALKPLLQQPVQFFLKFPFALSHHRRHQHNLGTNRQRQDFIHHLAHRLRLNRQPRRRRIRRPRARPQQAHIVVNLGNRPHRRARIVRGRFLLNRNRRRQPFYGINVRLFHQVKELPRISGKALDVTPLPLGINRVKRQRRLARPRQPGNHRQLVLRNGNVDVFEIMLPRPFDFDIFALCHRSLSNA